MKYFILFFLLSFLPSAFAEIEFYFTSAPTTKGRASNIIKFSNPLTGLSHTAFYLSRACSDSTNKKRPNLIRLCQKRDKDPGLVISFDITLQKELNLFFLALKKREFFYGTFKKENLPKSLSQKQIEKMDKTFIGQYPFLKNEDLYKRQLKSIGIETDMAATIVERLHQKGVSKKNLTTILTDLEQNLNFKKRRALLKVANYILKKKITKTGLSRRSVSWAMSFYKSTWSVIYPSTREEEKEIIAYINSQWSNKKANLINYNCVTPIVTIADILFAKKRKRPPLISLPYPLMNDIVKGAFKASPSKKNHRGLALRRHNSFMKFYPKLKTKIAINTYPTPTSYVHKAKMVRIFKYYLGQYTNNINLDLELMKENNSSLYENSNKKIKKLRDSLYEKEKALSSFLIDLDNNHIEGLDRKQGSIQLLQKEILSRYNNYLQILQ